MKIRAPFSTRRSRPAPRFAPREVYGKVQEAVAKDEAFAKLYANTLTFAELKGRSIAVGVDL